VVLPSPPSFTFFNVVGSLMEDEFRAGRIELLKHAAFFDSDTRWSVSRISRSKKEESARKYEKAYYKTCSNVWIVFYIDMSI
jgi:hypothetical protein